MAEYYIVYDVATGAVRWRGKGDPAQEVLPEGLAAIPAPATAIAGADIDLSEIQSMLAARVDAEASAFRSQFITVGPGQEMTYVFKAAEAKAWAAGAPDSNFPFLVAEAAATGVTVESVKTLVLTTSAQFIFLGSRIEGRRMGAKKGIKAAATLTAMVAAANIDWEALTVP